MSQIRTSTEAGSISETKNKARLFIGLPIPTEVLEKINVALSHYQQCIARTIPSENWHITMLFLGDQEWSQDKLELLSMAMPQVFIPTVNVTHIGRGLAVDQLWVHIRNTRILAELKSQVMQRAVEIKMMKRNEEVDRTFVPHISLAKLRLGNNARLVADRAVNVTWRADRINIYRSELKSSGAKYKIEGTINMQT